MGVPFAYAVGDYFWYPKHCALPKMRLGHALDALLETALVRKKQERPKNHKYFFNKISKYLKFPACFLQK